MVCRICRGVLWDVHGALLEHRCRRPQFAPAKRRREWAQRTAGVLQVAGALSQELLRDRLDPLVFWRYRMQEELSQTRERRTSDGLVPIAERTFQLQVNIALLKWVAPVFMGKLSPPEQVHLARALWRRRRTDQGRYDLQAGKRRVVHWLGKELVAQGFITAQAKDRAQSVLGRCRVPWSLFSTLVVSGEVGLPKSHPALWTAAREKLTNPPLAPEEVVCIEDNLAMGRNVVRAGMAVLLLDPDGEIQAFIREELDGKLAGAPLLALGDSLPEKAPFVMCPRGARELKQCLQVMRPAAIRRTS